MKKLLLALCLILTLLFTLTSTPVKAQTNEILSLSSVTLTIEDFPTSTYGIWRKCGNQKLSQIQQFWSELSKVEVGTKPTNVFCFGYSPKQYDDPSIQVISGFTQILLSEEEKAAFDNRLKLRQEQERGSELGWNYSEWSDFAWNKKQINDNKKFLSQEIIEAFRRGNVGVLISQAYKSDTAPLIYEIDKAFSKLDKRIVDIYAQIETAKLFENSESEPESSQSQAQPNLLSKVGELLVERSPIEKRNSTSKTQQQQQCEPSYPDLCIPPDLPDLNCSDLADRRFKVLPPDTYGFDRDGDGIGCER